MDFACEVRTKIWKMPCQCLKTAYWLVHVFFCSQNKICLFYKRLLCWFVLHLWLSLSFRLFLILMSFSLLSNSTVIVLVHYFSPSQRADTPVIHRIWEIFNVSDSVVVSNTRKIFSFKLTFQVTHLETSATYNNWQITLSYLKLH